MDLHNLKYSELQKLAKKCGIKANMKVEKLVNALKEHYSKQGQGDSASHTAEEDSNSQPTPAKEDPCPVNEGEDDARKKKASAQGRKKVQKKGPRGTAKKTSSSDETQEEDNKIVTLKKQTPQNRSASSKQILSPGVKQQSTSVGKQTASSKKTPQAAKTPTIVKPVSSKSLANRTLGVTKTTAASAKSPIGDAKKIHREVDAGDSTLGAKGPASRPSAASVRRLTTITSKKTSDRGKKPAPSTSKSNKESPASGSKKRCSPKNNTAEEKKEQDEAKSKATSAKAGKTRKRADTFELEGPSLASTATPEAEKTTKRARRSSGADQQDRTPTPSSPGIQDMIDSMTGDMNSAERRTRLMNALNKKVENKVVKSSPQTGAVTQIPRFAAFLAKKKLEQKKPITPGNKDWQKVHKKEFSKFDSIDVYLEKKRKRAEEMTVSVKKARTVLHEVQHAVTKLKSKRTPSMGRKSAAKPFKPSVISTKDMNLNFGASTSSSKTPGDRKSSTTASSKPFKPTVTSTKSMNLNFSSLMTPVNQKSAGEDKVTHAPQSSRKSVVGAGQMSARKSLGASSAAVRKSFSNTPFQFTGNLNMSSVKSSTSKPVFDLKASLARPITWKRHTGKLKPLDEYAQKSKGLDSSATTSHMDVFKSMVNRTKNTYSRHDRRVAAAAKRAEQKHDLQMKRRGIAVSP